MHAARGLKERLQAKHLLCKGEVSIEEPCDGCVSHTNRCKPAADVASVTGMRCSGENETGGPIEGDDGYVVLLAKALGGGGDLAGRAFANLLHTGKAEKLSSA